jgi:hypothetical protein
MVFDLSSLLEAQDFKVLILPFTRQELDDIVEDLPLDKAPGPNGLSGSFLKNLGLSSTKIFTFYVRVCTIIMQN